MPFFIWSDIGAMMTDKSDEEGGFDQSDLVEFCLWLYGIYEETIVESN